MNESRAQDSAVRVVIADDEPRARQFLEKMLREHEDFVVVASARNGESRPPRIA